MKKTAKFLSLLMVICMLFSSCSQVAVEVADANADSVRENYAVENVIPNMGVTNDVNADELSTSSKNDAIPEKGTYNEGVALVKYDGEMNENVLSQLDLVSATALYSGSTWYTVELKADADTVETVTYLRELDCFEKVDYDYIMGVSADVSSVDVGGNPGYELQNNLDISKINEGWEEIAKSGKDPGGSPDVVVAVIDTGVDYNHLDLRNNIWINTAEIPENGKDDDGNGYIDDICGWNCVGDNNNPMDDNGHGTHVAGIVAAENNKEGGIGVAYNCKVMVLKAGNSSGYFTSSDIAEAIQYAYMNGASVINMSFGGTLLALAVEEALENAYNTSILVAAAGNDGVDVSGHTNYPAALPYVIGVMSCKESGRKSSDFTNYDLSTPYDSTEYDVFACGDQVYSTWPNNKYATLSGTSMSTPTVSGIAALLRSVYPDRDTYSTKYIMSQIVNTGDIIFEVVPANGAPDLYHHEANLYDALTELPTPNIYNIYDQYIFDNVEYSPKNNGNGVIDAGETIRIAVELQNRGGVASNVIAKIDTIRGDDPDLTDPYFTIVKDTVNISDIGTYSVRDFGKIYDTDGNWIGTEKYFEVVVSEDCPNSYCVDFNLRITYENGLDEEDNTVYRTLAKIQCMINRGYHLSGNISEDTIFEPDRLYIVSSNVVIPKDVTVTFKAGCQIQYYDDREYADSPAITVYGTLNFDGTQENMIDIFPDDQHMEFGCMLVNVGTVNFSFVNAKNLSINSSNTLGSSSLALSGDPYTNTFIEDSHIIYTNKVKAYKGGSLKSATIVCFVDSMNRCYMNTAYRTNIRELNNSFLVLSTDCRLQILDRAYSNIFYTYHQKNTGLPGYIEFGRSESANNLGCVFENNIITNSDDSGTQALIPIERNTYGEFKDINNCFSKDYQKYADQIIENYYDSNGNPIIDVYSSLNNAALLWPHVVSVEMFDKDGNPITTVGKEEIKVRITFNRPMDKNAGTFLTFGTIEPYGDYRIDGGYISDTVWEGTYTLKAQIENGLNYLKVGNATAAEDPTMVLFSDYMLHEFNIDTTAAMSMNLQAVAKENGIELTFAQDDYDTLLGYNIYRADSKDGNYVKLNPAILLPTDEKFLDENAEPGKTYWYTYTVVLTDFSESNPAGKVVATAMDTISPNMYHTPVNQGYMNNNLVISCTASDNVAISTVTLYYRAVGATEWKSLNMAKQSDKYSATIFGSDLTLDGIEYYIVASDGVNTINKGSAETPYTVVIKDASAISRKGDVDGDGTITTKDALMLMQTINEDRILTDDEFKRADLNGNGVLNSSEALRILQYINGNVTTLEM